MFSILDANRGRVFTYDNTGMLLYIFGTYGDMGGALKNPRAIDKSGDLFLVLDGSKNTVTAYSPTAYARSFDRATAYHYQDEYELEAQEWRTILSLNGNSNIAYTGLGKAAFRTGRYEEAMEYFHKAGDRANYSKAFQYRRREIIADGFMWAVPVFLAVLALLVVGVKLKRRYCPARVDPQSFRGKLAFGRYVAFHPMDGFWDLKRENRGSLRVALLFTGLLCVVMVAQRQLTGFLFNTANIKELNLLIEISKVLLPFGLWCISNWCVTSLMQGREIAGYRHHDRLRAPSHAGAEHGGDRAVQPDDQQRGRFLFLLRGAGGPLEPWADPAGPPADPRLYPWGAPCSSPF